MLTVSTQIGVYRALNDLRMCTNLSRGPLRAALRRGGGGGGKGLLLLLAY